MTARDAKSTNILSRNTSTPKEEVEGEVLDETVENTAFVLADDENIEENSYVENSEKQNW